MPACDTLAGGWAMPFSSCSGYPSCRFCSPNWRPETSLTRWRLDPRISAATLSAMRVRYGLDQSLPEKYVRWLQSVGRGELGFSVTHNAPVGPLLWRRARNTLLLTVPATALAWLIAIPLGIWAAARKGQWTDRAAAAATTTLLSVPDLLLGLGCLLLAVRTGYFPTGGMVSLDFAELGAWSKVKDVISHFFMPVTALLLVNLPGTRPPRPRQSPRRAAGPLHSGRAGAGHSGTPPDLSGGAACSGQPVDFTPWPLDRRRCSVPRSSSRQS